MKIKITKGYDDLGLKRPVKINEEFTVTNERGMFLINKHVAEIIDVDDKTSAQQTNGAMQEENKSLKQALDKANAEIDRLTGDTARRGRPTKQ